MVSITCTITETIWEEIRLIRNLFKRIAEFVTGSSKDDDSSAIPFAELSRKKAEEQAKKERAERKRHPRDKKSSAPKREATKPQRGDSRQRSQEKSTKQSSSRRATDSPKPRDEKSPDRKSRPSRNQRPEREPIAKKEAPSKNDTQKQPRKPTWSLEEFQVPEKEGEVRFHDFDLPVKLMHGIAQLGFQYATPIQAGCLPETLKGRDAIGKAQTGTGKSAAFLITIIDHIAKKPMRGGPDKSFPRALILAPTRELALQIEKDTKDLCKYTPYTIVSLFGGTGYEKQKKGMAGSVDIIVATPGRLIDFKNQRLVDLSRVEILVIDEADRMLDMGFIPDIRKIVYSTPPKEQRQTLFFSATYSSDVMRLAEQWTKAPHHMEIEPEKVEASSVDQKIFLVTTDEKFPLLYNLIIGKKLTKVLVFTNRRDQARHLAEKLTKLNIKADLLSGEVAQNKRIRALEDFRSGKVEVLVATDVAARGLHIDEISHVINYTLPQDPEHYVHRIGRTGRAGATGISVSFACEDDSYYIPAIEELLGHKLHCEYPADELLQEIKPSAYNQRQQKPQRSRKQDSPEAETEIPDLETPPAQEAPRDEAPRRESRKPRHTQRSQKNNGQKGQATHSPWLDPIALEEIPDDDETPMEPEPRKEPVAKADPVEVVKPEPVEVTEPEPVEVTEPEPVEASEPEPVEVTEPEPVKVTEPEPVKVTEPEPVKASEPEPVKASEPEPVKATEPEPVEVTGPEPAETTASSAPRKPKSPRPVRQTRRPNAPKYRKHTAGRYTGNSRTNK